MATNREIPIQTIQTDSRKCSNDNSDYKEAIMKGKETQTGGSTRFILTGNPDNLFGGRAFNCFQDTATWEFDLYFLMARYVLLRINRQTSERNLPSLICITERWHWFPCPKKKWVKLLYWTCLVRASAGIEQPDEESRLLGNMAV
jgi:hypothetical protein